MRLFSYISFSSYCFFFIFFCCCCCRCNQCCQSKYHFSVITWLRYATFYVTNTHKVSPNWHRQIGRRTDGWTDVLTDRQTYINKYLYRKIYIYESVCLSVFLNEVGQTQGMTLYHLNQTLTQQHTMYILWLAQYESYHSDRLFTKTIFMSKRFGYYWTICVGMLQVRMKIMKIRLGFLPKIGTFKTLSLSKIIFNTNKQAEGTD